MRDEPFAARELLVSKAGLLVPHRASAAIAAMATREPPLELPAGGALTVRRARGAAFVCACVPNSTCLAGLGASRL